MWDLNWAYAFVGMFVHSGIQVRALRKLSPRLQTREPELGLIERVAGGRDMYAGSPA